MSIRKRRVCREGRCNFAQSVDASYTLRALHLAVASTYTTPTESSHMYICFSVVFTETFLC
jgi:hypothetical protein